MSNFLAVQLPDVGFVRLKQIIGDKQKGIPGPIPVSASTWWAGVAVGKFPKPVKLGNGISLWRVEEIRALIIQLAEGAVLSDPHLREVARAPPKEADI